MADATTPTYGFTQPEPGGSDNTWGDKLNANWGALDTLLANTFAPVLPPIGTILMFDATTGSLPANWAVCDGTNGTPDLRDRFILGASATRPAKSTGGKFAITDVPAHTHAKGTLAADSGGAHTHTGSAVSGGAHTHPSPNGNYLLGGLSSGIAGWTGGGAYQYTGDTDIIASAGAHTHSLTINSGGTHPHTISGSVASAGVASVDITPPYYAVIYIRRMT